MADGKGLVLLSYSDESLIENDSDDKDHVLSSSEKDIENGSGDGLDGISDEESSARDQGTKMSQVRQSGPPTGAEGVTVRGPGNTGGPGVQNCQV